MDIGRVLRRLRVEERHLTLNELAEAIDGKINPTTLSRMESKNQTITPEYLQILADFHQLKVTDIIQEAEGGAAADPAVVNAMRVPLLEWGDVRAWLDSRNREHLRAAHTSLVGLPPMGPNTYAVTVSGDSMQSDSAHSFPEGYLLYVDPDRTPNNLDYAVYIIGGGAPMLRQQVQEGPETYLKAINRNYRPTLKPEQAVLAGTAVQCTWRPKH